jgi:FixJ family two-component response regulator
VSGAEPIIHVVDDDASFRNAVARLLLAAGFQVRPYASVSAFLAAGGASATGCVLVDLRMPGQSGLDLQQSLLDAGNPIPVIFVSAYADVPNTVRAMRAGAVDFLTKPVEKGELFAAVERALARAPAADPSRHGAHRS